MAEKSFYRTATISTLAPSAEMWLLPEERVKEVLLNQLPKMHRTVADWIIRRPNMKKTFEVKSQSWFPYKRNPLTRKADCLRYAAMECAEFINSVRSHDEVDDVKLEFGDVFFWLLLYDQAFDPTKRTTVSHLVDRDFVLQNNLFKHNVRREDTEMLKTLEGELAVFMAINLLQGQFSNDVPIRYINIGKESIYAYLDMAMMTLGRYAISQNWDMAEIISQVATKNERNYPRELFHRMSAFDHDVDAIDFLNVLRQPGRKRSYFIDLVEKRMTDEEMHMLQHIHPSMFVTGLVEKYRLVILEQLKEIESASRDDIKIQMAQELIKVGHWDDVLLIKYFPDLTMMY